MKLRRVFLLSTGVLSLLFFYDHNEVRSSSHTLVFTFDASNLSLETTRGYDILRYRDLELTGETGAPQLPVRIVRLALPPGSTIGRVDVTNVESQELKGTYTLFPVQPPQPLSQTDIRFHTPDAAAYASSKPYPEVLVTTAPSGYLAGYALGALLVHPVQYIPSTKTLWFHSKIEVEITYKERSHPPVDRKSTDYSDTIHRTPLETLVTNPDGLWKPYSMVPRKSSILPDEEHRYVIITSELLATHFQPVADWKYKKGLSATIVTTEWIYTNYSGEDIAEQVRNFIIDAYQNWGTMWVLLGGDIFVVPYRLTYAMDSGWGPSFNAIPCDLYFADLDGDWDANGNGTYGEVADNVDMYPDLYVGRASVESINEAYAFVSKLLTYEKTPAEGHELDMLFLAEILWDDPYTNSGLGKDHIDSLYVPARFDSITKLYEALGNENYATVMEAINEGYGIINHDGHASYAYMGVGAGGLTNADVDYLTNGPKYSVLFSIGCLPAAIDEDCIAEHFITNLAGGGVAFVGNSRFGWGSPGNPLYGYSDRFDQQFFKALLRDEIVHIGQALAAAKAVYVPYASQENVYRWCEFELNLLGDPEMMVWTNTPKTFAVTTSDSLPIGDGSCPVTVMDGSSPVQGALVCLMQDSTVYATGFTGPDGRITLPYATSNPASPVHLTITGKNFIPFEGVIKMVANEPCVFVSNYSCNDRNGGRVVPGEAVVMDVCFKNFGSQTASNVTAVLTSGSAKITITDGTEAIGTLLAGDSVVIASAYAFDADAELENGEIIHLTYYASDDASREWESILGVTGATPLITCDHHQVIDQVGGDGDDRAEPGETIHVSVITQNLGLLEAEQVTATLSSMSPYLSFIDGTLEFGTLPPSEYSQHSGEIAIHSSCPSPSFIEIKIDYQTLAGFEFADCFYIAVGDIGYRDDMENGEGGWTHSGADDIDLWHLSTNRKHSGNYSWYCGAETSTTYLDTLDNVLESAPVMLEGGSVLSFWSWYECAMYGVDGFYVDVNDGSGWTTLDFIGSGGALATLPIGNDWLEYRYDLSNYPAGTMFAFRFRFISDEEGLAEGVYIDDVAITRPGTDWITPVIPPPGRDHTSTRLLQNYPNPFNPLTAIEFSLETGGPVRIDIYDVRGARVRTLMNGIGEAGVTRLEWDGTNASGHRVSSGVYFYRMVAGKFTDTKKMVMLE